MDNLDIGDEPSRSFTSFFKPIKLLGQGAFGKVIQAIDISTGEELAIKVVSKKKMGEEFIKRVKQEARILEQMNHPNVVSFKRVCETDTRILIAMELVKGGSLSLLMKERLTSQKWLNEKDVSIIMKSIMQGLAYIHAQNIVHKDLKPENILIGDQNDFTTVKIVDFGLSSAFSLWTSSGLTEQCGTLLYMAPEFFSSRAYSKVEFIAFFLFENIWSCGITMYFLLDKGNHPFYDPTVDNSESFKIKLVSPKWKFPSQISSLARNLLEKVSLFNPTERYSAIQVLQHPFITEKTNGIIPMTMHEHIMCLNTQEKMAKIIKGMILVKFLCSIGETVQADKKKPSIIKIEANQQIKTPEVLVEKQPCLQKQPYKIYIQKQKTINLEETSPLNPFLNQKKRLSLFQPKENNNSEMNLLKQLQVFPIDFNQNNSLKLQLQSIELQDSDTLRSKSQAQAKYSTTIKKKILLFNKDQELKYQLPKPKQQFPLRDQVVENNITLEINKESTQAENKKSRGDSSNGKKLQLQIRLNPKQQYFTKNLQATSINFCLQESNKSETKGINLPSTPIQNNYKENRVYQNYQESSSIKKKYFATSPKQQQQQNISEFQSKNRIPLRGFTSFLQNKVQQCKSLSREDDIQCIQQSPTNQFILPFLKEKKFKASAQSKLNRQFFYQGFKLLTDLFSKGENKKLFDLEAEQQTTYFKEIFSI